VQEGQQEQEKKQATLKALKEQKEREGEEKEGMLARAHFGVAVGEEMVNWEEVRKSVEEERWNETVHMSLLCLCVGVI
jgi:hypothetical protein